jgi:hypothetical protein
MTFERTIFMVISNGFAARFLLRSGVLDRLKEEHRIVVLSPNAGESYFREEFEGPNVFVRNFVNTPTRLQDNFERWIWQVLTPSRLRDDTMVMEIIDKTKNTSPLRHFILKNLNTLTANNRLAWAGIRALDNWLVRDRYHDELFLQFNPDLVLVTSAGYEIGTLYMLRNAKAHGVRTLNAIQGWDNLSDRGPMREKADKLIVWNEINKREAVELRGYAPSDVFIGGVPHFDIYNCPSKFSSWGAYCRRTGLDPGRKLVLLGGTTPDVTDGFDDVVQILAEGIDQNRFVSPCQLLIRPHPIVFSGWTKGQGMKEHLDRYRKMGRHVFCDEPDIRSRVLMADLAREDSGHLAETLYYSSVVVNFFSTLMVDAAALDRPILCVDFDGFKKRDYYHSVVRIKSLRSISNVLNTGAVKIAAHPEELIALINRYLVDPTLESAQREKLRSELCYCLDGKSAERYAQCISEYARGNWLSESQITARAIQYNFAG